MRLNNPLQKGTVNLSKGMAQKRIVPLQVRTKKESVPHEVGRTEYLK